MENLTAAEISSNTGTAWIRFSPGSKRRAKSSGNERRESLNSEKKPNTSAGQVLAKGEEGAAANKDQLLHVSEEAAELARILDKDGCGQGGPELEQGTPIEDVSLLFFFSFPAAFPRTSSFPLLLPVASNPISYSDHEAR